MQKALNLIAWAMAAFIVYIYVWYLQYKFLEHPGSVALFTTLTDWLGFPGHEKFMRIGTGSTELVASILLVIPAMQILGAALSFCIITGAIFFHLASPLGIDPYGDGGVLFKQACGVWVASLAILVIRRQRAIELIGAITGVPAVPTERRPERAGQLSRVAESAAGIAMTMPHRKYHVSALFRRAQHAHTDLH